MILLASGGLIRAQEAGDTLRSYGPRFGIDIGRLAYVIGYPPQLGSAVFLDFEVSKNIYPVLELGYSSSHVDSTSWDYNSSGFFALAGIDYNLLHNAGRSEHHTITAGLRYGFSNFSQDISNIIVHDGIWGDYSAPDHRAELHAHWIEILAGMRAEVAPNFFLGWHLRYRFLLNPEMDPLVSPLHIPGYGKGSAVKSFGLSYSLAYKIPLFKR
ncbi:MAG: hypothetical protein CSA96_08710 [Bacteroidetes bacterium]|nr:MAG: hypothetical protein CSA96_08710 [Bacteroidota bacterium]